MRTIPLMNLNVPLSRFEIVQPFELRSQPPTFYYSSAWSRAAIRDPLFSEMSIGLASFPDSIYTAVTSYIKAVFNNIVMWRLDKSHWADSFIVGNRNIGTSFRACLDTADNFLELFSHLCQD